MRCKYTDKDLTQRLDATICRYMNFPYYVRHHGRDTLALYNLDKTDDVPARLINSDDPLLDISTVPLGYVQEHPTSLVIYTYRKPTRMYKQALHKDAIGHRNLKDQSDYMCHILSKRFENMIQGVYPSIDETFEKFKKSEDKDMEIAISRDIALKFTHKMQLVFIYFKNEEAGWLRLGTKTVIVPNTQRGWIISKYLSQFNWKID